MGKKEKKGKKDKKEKENKRKYEADEANEQSRLKKVMKTIENSLAGSVNYIAHEEVSKMSETEVMKIRDSMSMTVHGYYSNDNQLFKPMTAFKHLKPTLGDLYKVIDNYVSQKGFKEPSPIQKQCWP